MGRRASHEEVFVSFHFLSKVDGKFSEVEFEQLCKNIEKFPRINIQDKKNVELMRTGNLVPLTDYQKLDGKRAFGAFHATYTGHSYENNEKGTITSRSINVRKFYYLLNLTRDGRIAVGAQYLGTFGGYGDILYAVKKLLPDGASVQSTSVLSKSYLAKDAAPKEVKLTIQKPPKALGAKPSLVERGVVALQRSEKGSPFEEAVKKRILPIFRMPVEKRKDALIKELQETGLFEFNDEELANCNVVIDVNGRTETLYLFDNGVRATKFHVEVPLTNDGHPVPDQLLPKILGLLDTHVINNGKP